MFHPLDVVLCGKLELMLDTNNTQVRISSLSLPFITQNLDLGMDIGEFNTILGHVWRQGAFHLQETGPHIKNGIRGPNGELNG